MLDAQTIATVKATIPLLVETGPKLTAHFYDRMFTHNPELKEIFNMSNQRNGDQREALFNAIAAYASNIENLPALLPAVEKIAQKHTSFQIKPEQYNIVGTHLLATLDEMFNPGQEVLDAWGKAYGVLANVFIHREAEIYHENASKDGGWEGTRLFRIVAKTPRSALITSFEFEPVDGGTVAEYRPGQYLGVWLKPEGFVHQEIRQYSLTRKPDGKGYRIAVKREDGGQVSNWLHHHASVGDVVHLAAPAGDFFMNVAADYPRFADFRWRRPDADVGDARYAGERTAYRAGELVPCGGERRRSCVCRRSKRAGPYTATFHCPYLVPRTDRGRSRPTRL